MDIPNQLAQYEDVENDRGSEAHDPGMSAQERTDGRSLRRERNRDAVIVALIELIREGNHAPGTSEIAVRAGVSHRSVFRYFDDLDDLVRAAIEHEIAEVLPLAILPNVGEGPVGQRIDAVVDSLLRVYNHTSPIARVARARSLAIPAIERGLQGIVQLYRSQLADHFAPELGALEPEQADDLLDAIQIVVSFEAFDLLRRRLDRADDVIGRLWTTALSSLLRA